MSHFNIQNFISNLGESARPNMFKVEIVGGLLGADVIGKIPFVTCQGEVPQSTIDQIELRYRGRQVFEPGERTYSPWTCQMYNDTGFTIRAGLEDWSNAIRNPDSVNGVTSKARYAATVYVKHLNREGQVVRTYVLYNAWPQEIQAIQLDYSNGNTAEMFGVTFVYDYFEAFDNVNDATNKSKSLPGGTV